MKPTLLILAAGIGSRFQGMKQLEGIGPDGEIIIDYSVYDSIRAGFKKVVFVIQPSFEKAFREKVGQKIAGSIETDYAFQQQNCFTKEYAVNSGRAKPWGTAHAVLCAKEIISDPFVAINADDFYGPEAFKIIIKHILQPNILPGHGYGMVGYKLANTLSDYGTVSRGICEFNEGMFLKKITEHHQIEKKDRKTYSLDDDNDKRPLTGNETVSMNFWGFQPEIFIHLEKKFAEFLNRHGQDLKLEFLLPHVIDQLIESQTIHLKVLRTSYSWFGITYKPDLEIARSRMKTLIDEGLYPKKLFK